MASRPTLLPTRLCSLVRVVEAALGEVIREAEGPHLYDAICSADRPWDPDGSQPSTRSRRIEST
jgi:hypothetical protein